MPYIFDTSSLITLKHFYPSRFPSLWESIDEAVLNGDILSVREVYNELEYGANNTHVHEWAKLNKPIFLTPDSSETTFVGTIFSVNHFRTLITQRNLLKGMPVADPFVIAAAKIKGCCVVTEEKLKPNAAKIPNVCAHFSVEYTDLEGFMVRENWSF